MTREGVAVLKGIRFVAIMLAALTLGLGFCHLMQLPSRMGWDQYLWVGSTVQGGGFTPRSARSAR